MLIINLQVDKSRLNPYISNTLLEKINLNIEKNKKSIIYLNKRWEFSSLICKECSKIYRCNNCDISLSIHRNPEEMVCHLCSYKTHIPRSCDNCKWINLEKIWIWTQQIESFFLNKYPNKNIFRFDTDQTKKISEKKLALKKLEEADIVIWTKMITTWFNIKNIWLIVVLLIEQEISIPKYNVEENVYSNIKQLMWRGNRAWEETQELIQTFIPQNDIVKSLTEDNYKNFFKNVLIERKKFSYPPYFSMATIEYKDKNREKAKSFIEKFKDKLDTENKKYNLVETINLVSNFTKKQWNYYYKIIIKSRFWNNIGEDKIRLFLENVKDEILKNKWLVVIFE